MPTISATEARATLYTLLDEIAVTHEPVLITGKRHNGVRWPFAPTPGRCKITPHYDIWCAEPTDVTP